MVNSFEELEQLKGLIPVTIEWGGVIPFETIIKEYSRTGMLKDIQSFVKESKELKLNVFSSATIQKLGLIAESNNLILAYFIVDALNVHLIFYPLCPTDEWLSLFKDVTFRRTFFNYIHTYKQTKVFEPYPNTDYYQLINVMLPNDWSTDIITLNKQYILTRITSDFEQPIISVYKVGKTGLTKVNHTINFHKNLFNHIELIVEDTVFTGSSFSTLWDGVEKNKDSILTYSSSNNKLKYSLDTDQCIVQVVDYLKFERRFYSIPRFVQTKSIEIIKEFSDNSILLNNGFIWYRDTNEFKNVHAAFPNIDIKILNTSANSDYVIISRIKGGIEFLSIHDFKVLLDITPSVELELLNTLKS